MPLLEIDGKNPRYWSHVAQVLHRLGRFEEEFKYWRKVIQIDPHYEGEWKGIGDCLFTLGGYQEAIEPAQPGSGFPRAKPRSTLPISHSHRRTPITQYPTNLPEKRIDMREPVKQN